MIKDAARIMLIFLFKAFILAFGSGIELAFSLGITIDYLVRNKNLNREFREHCIFSACPEKPAIKRIRVVAITEERK